MHQSYCLTGKDAVGWRKGRSAHNLDNSPESSKINCILIIYCNTDIVSNLSRVLPVFMNIVQSWGGQRHLSSLPSFLSRFLHDSR
jgi:hypothetical protein